MIHRYLDVFQGCPNRGFAVIASGGFGSTALWLVQHSQTNVELTNSREFTGSLGDPNVNRDFCDVLYSRIPNTGLINYVSTVQADDSASADIASSSTHTATSQLSLQPSWHPSGQQVVFRGIDHAPSNAGPPTIERCDRDGSNHVTLVSGALPSGAGSTSPYRYPFYSDDGTKILTFQDRVNILDIFTTDADGTNDVLVARTVDTNTSVPIWIPGTTTVCYTTSTGTTGAPLTGSQQVRTVEADGTGDALLYQDPESQSASVLWSTNPFSALPDGSGIVYAQYFPGDPANFNYRIGIIDTGTGTWTALSPTRTTAAFQFNINLPVVRGGRIWWDDGMSGAGGDGIVSVALDGSDYTVEDNTSVFTQKWWGT